jgi:hypothetical protein
MTWRGKEYTDPNFEMMEFRCKKCGAVAWKEINVAIDRDN